MWASVWDDNDSDDDQDDSNNDDDKDNRMIIIIECYWMERNDPESSHNAFRLYYVNIYTVVVLVTGYHQWNNNIT